MTQDDFPRPTPAATEQEFVAHLRQLKAWCGLTYRQLERNASAAGQILPHSTLGVALRRNRLPREELLASFVRACGGGPDDVAAWLAARRELAMNTALHAALATASTDPAASADAHATNPAEAAAIPAARRQGGPTWLALRARSGTARPPWRHQFLTSLGLAALLLLLSAAGVHRTNADRPSPDRPADDFAAAQECGRALERGSSGTCTRHLQLRLQRHGLRLPADGSFGPYTKMRVRAFQVFAGLVPTGIVDAPTWTALGAERPPPIPRWSTQQIKQRLQQIFGDDAHNAIALARCLSNMDPLWIYSRKPGVQGWGLFQFTDLELHQANVPRTMALNPDWSIQAAHAVWSRTRSFQHWSCRPGILVTTPAQRT